MFGLMFPHYKTVHKVTISGVFDELQKWKPLQACKLRFCVKGNLLWMTS